MTDFVGTVVVLKLLIVNKDRYIYLDIRILMLLGLTEQYFRILILIRLRIILRVGVTHDCVT